MLTQVDISRIPNDDKFRELVLFVCERSEGDPRFGATKLNKILFYSDFLSYVQFGKPITGHMYQSLEQGPAPKAMLPILDKMKADGEVAQAKRNYYGKEQTVTKALRSADLNDFSAEEIALVTQIIEDCWSTNAAEISGMSHKFIGWEAARVGEDIPYQTALVQKNIKVTDAMIKTGEHLEPLAKACLARIS